MIFSWVNELFTNDFNNSRNWRASTAFWLSWPSASALHFICKLLSFVWPPAAATLMPAGVCSFSTLAELLSSAHQWLFFGFQGF
jgi:hypothetical protein